MAFVDLSGVYLAQLEKIIYLVESRSVLFKWLQYVRQALG